MNLRAIGTVGYIGLFLLATFPKRKQIYRLYEVDPAEASRQSHYYVDNAIKKILKITGSTLEVEGTENIPDGVCLYAGNHQSLFDVMAVELAIPGGVGFVAKDSLKKIPGLSSWMELLHCLFLDRSDPREGIRILLKGVDYLKEGYPMFIFPEGTRNDGKTLLEFKGGSLKIAQKAKCPIIPVAITGTRDIFENNKGLSVKPSHIKVTFGKALEPAKLPKSEQKLLMGQLKESIESLLVNQQN